MNKILPALLLICCMQVAFGQQHPSDSIHNAVKLENQIRQYFFVMLLKGNNRTQDSVTAAKIQDGHMANINRLYKAGKLKVAGPFGDEGEWKGIFIFDCASKQEVEELLKSDPAVIAGRLKYEIHPWWTAAIGSFSIGKPTE